MYTLRFSILNILCLSSLFFYSHNNLMIGNERSETLSALCNERSETLSALGNERSGILSALA
jgi:hypothetical protein